MVGGSLGVIWATTLLNWLLGGMLTTFAIHPRYLSGLLGIAVAPFLHGDFAHLIGNSVTFMLLGLIATARNKTDFMAVAIGTAISSGLCAWLLGAGNSVHLGASGVIFGFLGFLMARGWFERSFLAIGLSLLVTFAFGSMVFGVFPILAGAGISWQGHLGGYLGGIAMAKLLADQSD